MCKFAGFLVSQYFMISFDAQLKESTQKCSRMYKKERFVVIHENERIINKFQKRKIKMAESENLVLFQTAD